ncbi:hypothetical protein WA026_012696 [Henosepilachna vigintioctopunctata]|uniref:Uncharacterized protein n=1 Tax=Henosepilachna vigintioctopunctata TaxID=420089 RepID=A0AAW1U1J5_9CUCU
MSQENCAQSRKEYSKKKGSCSEIAWCIMAEWVFHLCLERTLLPIPVEMEFPYPISHEFIVGDPRVLVSDISGQNHFKFGSNENLNTVFYIEYEPVVDEEKIFCYYAHTEKFLKEIFPITSRHIRWLSIFNQDHNEKAT